VGGWVGTLAALKKLHPGIIAASQQLQATALGFAQRTDE